ncbi:hypothetical protein SGLAM104S_07444 [Streptomyces glaucescens]
MVHLYEDPRCPACASFEQTIGETVNKGMEDGDYKLSFTLGTFLDGNLTGEGSKNALSALGAALNVSPDAFLDYKAALYSAKYHPAETSDEFAEEDEYLIKVADTVEALKNNKKFQDAVEKGTYDAWAMRMSDTFDDTKDVKSTPTIKINDKVIENPRTVADLGEGRSRTRASPSSAGHKAGGLPGVRPLFMYGCLPNPLPISNSDRP